MLANGLEDYVALFRAGPVGADLEAMRLLGDLGAGRFSLNARDAGDLNHSHFRVRSFDTHIAAPGREIAARVYDPFVAGSDQSSSSQFLPRRGRWRPQGDGGGLSTGDVARGNSPSTAFGGPPPPPGEDLLRPAILYIHGGGFSLGSIESFDIVGRALAEAAGAVVVSVEYRRLPDTDYAGAQADCDLALAWLGRQAEGLGVDPARIAVAGDSAGALLAVAAAVNAAVRPAALLLFYGTFAMDAGDPAYDHAADPLLSGDRVRAYIDLFLKCGGHSAPVERDLAGLPPMHVVAAEHDPLCGEAVRFVERAGASIRIAPGMIHGFLRAAGVSAPVRDEIADAAGWLKTIFER